MVGPPLQGQLPADLEPRQRVLDVRVEAGLVDLAGLVRQLELGELAHDAGLVVELELSLLGDLLGEPDDSANRRKRQRQQTGDQAHAAASCARSANECAASGPMSLNRRSVAWSAFSRSTAAS